MQVRLAFSVAIKADAQVYLMDEVLAVGDMAFQQKCFDVFRRLKKEGKTIILVSHDLVSVRQMCNRALYLKNGRVDKIGDINEIVDRYTYDTGRVTTPVSKSPTGGRPKEKARPSVEITGVDLVDKYGHRTSTFVSQDPVRIEVRYRRHDAEADRPLVGMAIYREDGVHVYGTNSRIEEQEIRLADAGKVILDIPALHLIQGAYLLSVGFRDQAGNIYDLKDRAYPFHVQRQKPNDGIVDLNVGYRHES
jgi:ABC-type multidrug transport system ATPase subunit